MAIVRMIERDAVVTAAQAGGLTPVRRMPQPVGGGAVTPPTTTATPEVTGVQGATGSTKGAQRARTPTGFPSPAEDMAERPLSLDDLLARHPASTYFLEMAGDAMATLSRRSTRYWRRVYLGIRC